MSHMPVSNAFSQISIFDLDRTITKHGTWSPFLLFAARRYSPWRLALVPFVLFQMGRYKLGLMNRPGLKQRMQGTLLGARIARDDIRDLASAFADKLMAIGIYAPAIDAIKAEQRAGRHVVIATAAHAYYAQAIAERLGVADVVATRAIWDADLLTPRLAGSNCYGEDKRRMIEDYLARKGLIRSQIHVRFYSDDMSDLPTFNWSDEPIAVNPSRKLLWHAMRSGWTVIDWRQKPRRSTNAMRASLRPGSTPIRPASPSI